MNARGQYRNWNVNAPPGTSRSGNPRIGIGLPHSIGDIEEEVKELNTEMSTFGQELRGQVFLQVGDKYVYAPGATKEKIVLYEKVWRPLMDEWLKFHMEHHDSFWQNLPFGGAWDRVQDFRTRLLKIRDSAKKESFKLQTPDPTPKTDGLDFKKIALIAGAGFAGLVALVLITRK